LHVPVSGALTANNGDVLRTVILAGVGVRLMPTFIVGKDLAAGRLEAEFEAFAPEPPGIYAVYSHRRHVPSKVHAFVDYLAEAFGLVPPWERLLSRR
jgi:DNA-binding transcriptional LysR family regulator